MIFGPAIYCQHGHRLEKVWTSPRGIFRCCQSVKNGGAESPCGQLFYVVRNGTLESHEDELDPERARELRNDTAWTAVEIAEREAIYLRAMGLSVRRAADYLNIPQPRQRAA